MQFFLFLSSFCFGCEEGGAPFKAYYFRLHRPAAVRFFPAHLCFARRRPCSARIGCGRFKRNDLLCLRHTLRDNQTVAYASQLADTPVSLSLCLLRRQVISLCYPKQPRFARSSLSMLVKNRRLSMCIRKCILSGRW
ncbi:hypothetical protein SAMN02910417_00902 [Eubacterium oxidoreducens]|uniref:Uncharacterized protein n=1 Tax=Eubacterium oxidoreducens TaxID=1732 RepID=A0A1G6AUP1_EUBOX|nr:hypothetical protein SAMN02910417_00902 [Eubacterium oxidoreducens]